MNDSVRTYLDHCAERDKKFLQALIDQGVDILILSLEHRLLCLRYRGKETVLLREKVYFNQKPGTLFSKNKHVTKLLLERQGIAVPRGFSAKTLSQVEERAQEQNLHFPVVLKPVDAAKGIGVTVGISSLAELKEKAGELFSFLEKSSFSSECIVEEQVYGNDFRILVFYGEVIACAERVPAYVQGDGEKNIQELIDTHNSSRPKSFLLKIDSALHQILDKQKLSLESIPEDGQRIILRKNANISSGGVAIDHSHVIDNHFKEIALKASRALGLNYCGVDLMTPDIADSSDASLYHVIEINGAPDYDIHEAPVIPQGGSLITGILAKKALQLLFS